MTILGSAVSVGGSLGSAITGAVGERFGSTTALALPAVAAVLVVLAGVSTGSLLIVVRVVVTRATSLF